MNMIYDRIVSLLLITTSDLRKRHVKKCHPPATSAKSSPPESLPQLTVDLETVKLHYIRNLTIKYTNHHIPLHVDE